MEKDVSLSVTARHCRTFRSLGTHRLLMGVLIGVATLWVALIVRRQPEFPGEVWAWKTPEEARFSTARLAEFSRKAGGDGCIVHGGRMIHEWGDPTFRNDAASSTKVFYTFLTLKALENGVIGSLDDRVADWAPELMELNAGLEFKDREVTFRHLLMQTSGYGLRERPGEAFAYNDYATGLLSWVLFYRVYGRAPMQYDEVLNGELLGTAIGFEHSPTVLHPNSPRGRLRISARDMARFALLHLRRGRWKGRQVLGRDLHTRHIGHPLPLNFPQTSGVEAEHLKNVRPIGGGKNEKHHMGCLGYYWWFNRITPDGTRLLPDAPRGTFMGSGYGGRFAMIVMPELDLIVVWMDVHRGEDWTPLDTVGRFKVNEMLRELLRARTPGTP